jgi:hypothetical protein
VETHCDEAGVREHAGLLSSQAHFFHAHRGRFPHPFKKSIAGVEAVQALRSAAFPGRFPSDMLYTAWEAVTGSHPVPRS